MRKIHPAQCDGAVGFAHQRKCDYRRERDGNDERQGAGQIPERKLGVRVPELSPDQLAQRVGQRGTAAAIPSGGRPRAAPAGRNGAGKGGPFAPDAPFSHPAVGRTVPARGHSPRRDRQSAHHSCRRADRKLRLENGCRGDGVAAPAQPRRGAHHRDGYPRRE